MPKNGKRGPVAPIETGHTLDGVIVWSRTLGQPHIYVRDFGMAILLRESSENAENAIFRHLETPKSWGPSWVRFDLFRHQKICFRKV